MVTNNKKLNAGKSEPKKKKFPDGTSLKQYGHYMTWTYRHWAWEFLCRNIKFKEACDKVEKASELSKSKVANEFHLVKFKHYADVQTKANVFPVFRDGAIKCVANLKSENIEQLVRVLPGQVLIRFKLVSEIDALAAIDAQLERARRRLYKLHAEYDRGYAAQAPISNKGMATNPKSLVQYLRILDLQASGITEPKKIAEYIYEIRPNSSQDVNRDNLVRKINRKLPEAQKYPKDFYLYLALKLGRPTL